MSELVKAVDDNFFRTVTIAAGLTWTAHGVQPNASLISKTVMPSVPPSEIARVLGTPEFAAEMYKRGIPWNEVASLSDRMITTLRIVSDPSEPGNVNAKLRRLGVKPAEYAEWKKNPLFIAHLQKMTADVLSEHEPEIQVALTNKALDGSLDHVKFLYEINGKGNAKAEQDFKSAMRQILDIIAMNVKDSEVLERIAQGVQNVLKGM